MGSIFFYSKVYVIPHMLSKEYLLRIDVHIYTYICIAQRILFFLKVFQSLVLPKEVVSLRWN
jgi:hypothetical protein